ncbi:MAG: GNAT family N-acetyltransferase [Alphaproteobacteria bacterium]|nr:GNAT family N-acetyltransferase [Alphaproteobacteria bacterium]
MAGLTPSVARATIERLEELGFNAWPALHTILRDGWVLRFTDGFTKRANSANPLHPGATPLPTLIADFEAAYASRGQRAIFRVTPLAPPSLDAELAKRGYILLDESIVMLAPRIEARAPDPDFAVEDRPAPGWLAGYAAASAIDAGALALMKAMLERIPPPAGFGSVSGTDGRPLAVGMAAVERGQVGLFDIVTAREARRRGLARHLVQGLLAWARTQGATSAYLQVVAANEPARRLYSGLGFVPAYGYHYRIAPV